MVESNLAGAPADEVERVGRMYQDDPGYMAVVFDGTKAVVVVDSAMLSAWQARLAPSGVAIAPSCVDPALIAAVDQVTSNVVAPSGTIISSGYDGLADAISVNGMDQDALVNAMGMLSDASRRAAIQGIANGTLRVIPESMPNVLTP